MDAFPQEIQSKLTRVVAKAAHPKWAPDIAVAVQKGNQRWVGNVGNLTLDKPFFIASTTKLHTVALILMLHEQGRLHLDDTLTKYFSPEQLLGLHVYRGKDYTSEITLRQLMAHTSGLPDYFQGKTGQGQSLLKRLTQGQDNSWSLEDVLALSKQLKPRFVPGHARKAHYSDTNFQLLGNVVEQLMEAPLHQCIQTYISDPLGLENHYLYTCPTDTTPFPLRYRDKVLDVPNAMASFGPDGGVVSTATDLLCFVHGFFNGKLFGSGIFPELMAEHRAVMFPLRYGTGLMCFSLPRLMTGFRRFPPLWGHSGLSGSFAFYCPEKDIYLAGTVNQVAQPGRSFRLLMALVQAMG